VYIYTAIHYIYIYKDEKNICKRNTHRYIYTRKCSLFLSFTYKHTHMHTFFPSVSFSPYILSVLLYLVKTLRVHMRVQDSSFVTENTHTQLHMHEEQACTYIMIDNINTIHNSIHIYIPIMHTHTHTRKIRESDRNGSMRAYARDRFFSRGGWRRIVRRGGRRTSKCERNGKENLCFRQVNNACRPGGHRFRGER